MINGVRKTRAYEVSLRHYQQRTKDLFLSIGLIDGGGGGGYCCVSYMRDTYIILVFICSVFNLAMIGNLSLLLL